MFGELVLVLCTVRVRDCTVSCLYLCTVRVIIQGDVDRLFYALRGTGEVRTIDFSGSSPAVKTIFKEVVVNYIKTTTSTLLLVRAPWGD